MIASKKTLRFLPECDYSLLGIVSTMKDYRVGHFLSLALLLEVEKLPDIEIEDINHQEVYYFSNYLVVSNNVDELIYLIGNRGSNGFFFQSLKEFDYFLLWIPSISVVEIEKINVIIRKIPDFFIVNSLKLKPAKDIDRLNWFMQ